jgi:hypothetical protein
VDVAHTCRGGAHHTEQAVEIGALFEKLWTEAGYLVAHRRDNAFCPSCSELLLVKQRGAPGTTSIPSPTPRAPSNSYCEAMFASSMRQAAGILKTVSGRKDIKRLERWALPKIQSNTGLQLSTYDCPFPAWSDSCCDHQVEAAFAKTATGGSSIGSPANAAKHKANATSRGRLVSKLKKGATGAAADVTDKVAPATALNTNARTPVLMLYKPVLFAVVLSLAILFGISLTRRG